MTFITTIRNKVSVGNSTSTTLAGNASFTGPFEDITIYDSGTITIISDQIGSIFLDSSIDGSTTDRIAYFKYEEINTTLELVPSFTSQYFRIRYTNDSASAQSSFKLQTVYRSDGGIKVDAAVTYNGLPLPSTNYDEFLRIRVGNPETIFDSNFTQTAQNLLWDEFSSGTATLEHIAPISYYKLEASNGGKAIHQTREYFPYQPGKSLDILMTGTLSLTLQDDTVSRIGYFDDSAQKTIGLTTIGDGLFFQLTGTVLSVVQRSSISGSQIDTVVNQDDWNIDRLDGNGVSSVTIDPTKRQIFFITQEWLGVGSVTMGIVTNRNLRPCHIWRHANTQIDANDNPTIPYTTRATLPVRYEITAGSGVTSTLHQVCCSVTVNGGYQPQGNVIFSANSGASAVTFGNTTGGTEFVFFALRQRTDSTNTYNRAKIKLDQASIGLITQTDNLLFKIYKIYSPTTVPTGVEILTFSNANTNSIAEVATPLTTYPNGTTSFSTAGTTFVELFSTYVFTGKDGVDLNDASFIPIELNSDIAGNPDYIVVTVTPFQGSSSVVGTLLWEEIY